MNISTSIHDTKEDPISKTHQENTIGRSPINAKKQQTLLSSADRVYLYGDRTYTGTLIHPVEQTSLPRWTVQLDCGGYEAVNIQHIAVIKSSNNQHLIKNTSCYDKPDLERPFRDSNEKSVKSTAELEQEIASLKQEKALLEAENQLIDRRYRQLERENNLLKKDLEQAKQIIRRAKDISPIMRLSLKRVLRLAHDACLDVQRTIGGWILRMGDRARKFKRLADIWDLLSVDEFVLSEIFPEDQLIAIDLIQPPPPRKKPQPLEKKTFPSMHPEDILRNRTMFLIPSG